MKNKILALAVAGAALGTAAISAPAQAQITGPATPIGVNVNVPEVLYLRTVSSITLDVTTTDLSSATLNSVTGGLYGSDQVPGSVADATDSDLDLIPPFGGGNTSNLALINKSIGNVYAIWSNSPRPGGITATVGIGTAGLTGPNGATATISNPRTAFGIGVPAPGTATSATAQTTAPGLAATPAVGYVTLDLNLPVPQTAGAYTGGVITIVAAAP
jgi:hypothetical protein